MAFKARFLYKIKFTRNKNSVTMDGDLEPWIVGFGQSIETKSHVFWMHSYLDADIDFSILITFPSFCSKICTHIFNSMNEPQIITKEERQMFPVITIF